MSLERNSVLIMRSQKDTVCVFKKLTGKHGVIPENIYNADETGHF